MKKILSVMLAIMMLFGALSVSASALTHQQYVNMLPSDKSAVIIVFEFYGGTSKKALPVYNPDAPNGENFVLTEEVGDTYYMLPGAGGNLLQFGSSVKMPSVTPPEGKAFVGWECSTRDNELTAGSTFTITYDDINKAYASDYGVIYMEAIYEAAEPEGDTMATVLGILMKVFGTILGILFLDGSSSAGVELMEKVLGGLL